MPVFIHQDDALDVMAQIEGERWKEKQLAITPESSDWGVSFYAFLAEYRRYAASGSTRNPADVSLSVHHMRVNMPVIYGHHGWNRYGVRGDGVIEFLVMQARCDEDFEKAKALGFDLFPSASQKLLG